MMGWAKMSCSTSQGMASRRSERSATQVMMDFKTVRQAIETDVLPVQAGGDGQGGSLQAELQVQVADVFDQGGDPG